MSSFSRNVSVSLSVCHYSHESLLQNPTYFQHLLIFVGITGYCIKVLSLRYREAHHNLFPNYVSVIYGSYIQKSDKGDSYHYSAGNIFQFLQISLRFPSYSDNVLLRVFILKGPFIIICRLVPIFEVAIRSNTEENAILSDYPLLDRC